MSSLTPLVCEDHVRSYRWYGNFGGRGNQSLQASYRDNGTNTENRREEEIKSLIGHLRPVVQHRGLHLFLPLVVTDYRCNN